MKLYRTADGKYHIRYHGLECDIRQIRYQYLRQKGYSPKVANRIKDWGMFRYHTALKRLNHRIKERPGEGVEFWKAYKKGK